MMFCFKVISHHSIYQEVLKTLFSFLSLYEVKKVRLCYVDITYPCPTVTCYEQLNCLLGLKKFIS
jgi:hypothetical protein